MQRRIQELEGALLHRRQNTYLIVIAAQLALGGGQQTYTATIPKPWGKYSLQKEMGLIEGPACKVQENSGNHAPSFDIVTTRSNTC